LVALESKKPPFEVDGDGRRRITRSEFIRESREPVEEIGKMRTTALYV
jgi:hypothetical protein